ncbi:MAG TPA: D-2-hydroxyacid dehydrogenase [Mobilitalea sp.]|nr:D-2-hydroxyacid dehydrogenase [Mobilitalea sp.]
MDRNIEILILTNRIFPMEDKSRELIENTATGAVITVVNGVEATAEMFKKAEVIFGWPEEEQLKRSVNLRWLHLPSAGADSYARWELYPNSNILLTNSSGVYGVPIAEHVLAMILAYNHNLWKYAEQQKNLKWEEIRRTRDFYGSTIGIIGMGDIGMELAKRSKALGARVLGVKRTRSSMPEYVDRLYTIEEIDEVLQQADYVVLALPNTQKTNGIVSEQRLRKMKPDAFLVNIGRGALVDQEALIKALKENLIGGVGLDVTEPEPLPQDNPLWELPNVMITPHVSGISPSNDRIRIDLFVKNLERYLTGEPLVNMVDFEEGY